MSLFRSSRSQGDEVRPISQDRLTELFDRQGWHYWIDQDGDLTGVWDGWTFYFIIAGSHHEILEVLGFLAPTVPVDARDALRVFIEDWHRDHFWPKCSFQDNPEDGSLRLSAQVSIDYEHGATDAQLMRHINCGIGTAGQVFEAARETFDLPTQDDEG